MKNSVQIDKPNFPYTSTKTQYMLKYQLILSTPWQPKFPSTKFKPIIQFFCKCFYHLSDPWLDRLKNVISHSLTVERKRESCMEVMSDVVHTFLQYGKGILKNSMSNTYLHNDEYETGTLEFC